MVPVFDNACLDEGWWGWGGEKLKKGNVWGKPKMHFMWYHFVFLGNT